MKTFNYITWLFLIPVILTGCQEDNALFGDVIAPTNLSIITDIIGVDAENPNGDGSGNVDFIIKADNALSYHVDFGDGLKEVIPSGETRHRFSRVGLNTYTILVHAVGTGGVTTSQSIDLDVFSEFEDDEAKQFLTGGSEKTWYWASAEPGHLGVGGTPAIAPDAYWYASFYMAAPFEKAGSEESSCLYESELSFSINGDNQIEYVLDNKGRTYFNAAHLGVVGQTNDTDQCVDFDTSNKSIVTLAPSTVELPEGESRGTVMNFSNDAFMSYYVGASSYEILEITNTKMRVRVFDALNNVLVWYHTFTSEQVGEDTLQYTNLVWSDEFDNNGAPDPAKWTYDIGTGSGGWGNGESQFYTDEPKNVVVEDGNLKITAIKENMSGSQYTSARLKTENLFEFTYGRIETRAKLPFGKGTWPAIWMLGEDYQTNIWPACGEIDIMEHIGNNQDVIHGSLHYPGNSGGNANGQSIAVPNVSTEFHVYETVWSPQSIKFYVDGIQFHTFANTPETAFNHDFFLILNVAMGGNFGGEIDPAFSNSTMEVDYIKVYQ